MMARAFSTHPNRRPQEPLRLSAPNQLELRIQAFEIEFNAAADMLSKAGASDPGDRFKLTPPLILLLKHPE